MQGQRTCSAASCDRPPHTRRSGLCQTHYRQELNRRAPSCSVAGCKEPRYAKGICAPHYKQRWHRERAWPRCSIKGCPNRRRGHGWCQTHLERWHRTGSTDDPRPTPEQWFRAKVAVFWSRVDKHGPIPEHRPELGPCWLWTHTLVRGYGRFAGQGVHRFAYKLLVGPIPKGLQIDHLCRVRNCVRPEHLEAVTQQENLRRGNSAGTLNARKTHCPQGHPYDEINTHRSRDGKRSCRQCARDQYRRRKAG